MQVGPEMAESIKNSVSQNKGNGSKKRNGISPWVQKGCKFSAKRDEATFLRRARLHTQKKVIARNKKRVGAREGIGQKKERFTLERGNSWGEGGWSSGLIPGEVDGLETGRGGGEPTKKKAKPDYAEGEKI